ncbi:MAG: carbon-nitrogen hydrolase family protein [Bacteroidales bacterium]|nr:carbon-nitrogen hydrolase family protein [Bacteroidales bacterium]
MKKIFIAAIITIFSILLIYFIWANADRKTEMPETHVGMLVVNQHRDSLINGNFLAIQPLMEPNDYQNANAFSGKLEYYFLEAKSRHWLHNNTIVVLPEYIVTWLVAAGEKNNVYKSKQVEKAMEIIVKSSFFSFINAYLSATAKDKVKDAVFRMKAGKMAKIYGNTLKKLAKKYQLTIVGGSIVLPNPKVENNEIIPQKGDLYNVSFLFHPDGSIDPKITRKIFPTKEEQDFLSEGKIADLPVYETPAGKLGIIICADSWYTPIYEYYQNKGCELIAVPSFMTPEGLMRSKWKGYSGYPNPADVDLKAIDSITDRQAWEKYAMAGKFRNYNFRAGVNVFMRGKLWDITTDGLGYSFVEKSLYKDQMLNTSILTNVQF